MRDDFSKPIKDNLAKRVGYRCSYPSCRCPTSGPQVDSNKSINVGVASHITAASPDGPRYDDTLTSEQRQSSDNGIWLCQKCGKLIDNDVNRYTVGVLRDWKKQAEENALSEVEGRSNTLTDPDILAFQYILTRAENQLKNTREEYNTKKNEHEIPFKDIIIALLPNILTIFLIFSDPININLYLVLWLITSFLILTIKISRSVFRRPPKTAKIQNSQDALSTLEEISKDENSSIIAIAYMKMLFENIKPFTIALSMIYILNIVVLIYLYMMNFDFGLYYPIILLLSAVVVSIIGACWYFKDFINKIPENILFFKERLNLISEESKDASKISIIAILGIVIFLFLIFIFCIVGPVILTILLLLQYKDFVLTHSLQFLLILLSQYLIILLFEVFFTRYYSLKWLERKITLLNSSVISPIDSILSEPSSFIQKNSEEICREYDRIRTNYLLSILIVPVKIDYYGFFIRYLLITNLNIIKNDEDIEILRVYSRRD